MKAKAVVQTGLRRFEMREFDVPEIGPEDGLLRLEQSGICGSDWTMFAHEAPAHPLIPGHEPVGVIEEIGELASARWGVKKGDCVAIESMRRCGFCSNCVVGRYTQCSQRQGSSAYGHEDIAVKPSLWGGHAEYMYLEPTTLVHKVDPTIPAELAVMFASLGGAVSWVVRKPGTGIGDTVVILGPRQRGIMAVVAAREAGAGKVIVTGVTADDHKLKIAEALGADRTVNVEQENVVEVVREMTDGEMADVVVDLAAAALQPVSDALDLAGQFGTIVLAAIKHSAVPEWDSRKVTSKELTIRGYLGVDYGSFEAAIRIIESRKYPLELMHTHTLPLAEAERALRILGNEEPAERGIHVSIAPN